MSKRIRVPIQVMGLSLGLLQAAKAATLHVNGDTYVDAAAPDATFGGAATLTLRNTASQRTALAQFDTSVLPADDLLVNRVYLRVWVNRVREPGTIRVEATLDRWDESTTTANTLPDTGSGGADLNVTRVRCESLRRR